MYISEIIAELQTVGIDTFLFSFYWSIPTAALCLILASAGHLIRQNIPENNITQPVKMLIIRAVMFLALSCASYIGLRLAGHGIAFIVPDEVIVAAAAIVLAVIVVFIHYIQDKWIEEIYLLCFKFTGIVFATSGTSAMMLPNLNSIGIGSFTVVLVVAALSTIAVISPAMDNLYRLQAAISPATQLQEA